MPAYVLQMDTDSFAEVDSYIPERWLPDISPAALSKLSGAHRRPTGFCCPEQNLPAGLVHVLLP